MSFDLKPWRRIKMDDGMDDLLKFFGGIPSWSKFLQAPASQSDPSWHVQRTWLLISKIIWDMTTHNTFYHMVEVKLNLYSSSSATTGKSGLGTFLKEMMGSSDKSSFRVLPTGPLNEKGPFVSPSNSRMMAQRGNSTPWRRQINQCKGQPWRMKWEHCYL